MADSAPDPKVEDVLASVRRLVSQELPKRPEPKPVSEDKGALVLTSKDRIEADPKARIETRSLEQRIAELEAAVDSTAHEFEPDGSEDQSLHRPDRIVYTRPRPSEEGVSARARTTLRLSEIALIDNGGSAAESDSSTDEPVAFRRASTPVETPPEAPMAEDVPTLPTTSAELHAFSDPDDVVARIEARIERGVETPEPVQVPESDERFDAALTAAVAASLKSTAADEALNDVEDYDAADTVSAEEAAGTKVTQPEPDVSEPVVARAAEATRQAQPVAQPAETEKAEVSEEPAQEVRAVPFEPTELPSTEATEPGTATPVEPAETPTASAEAALKSLPDEEAMRLLVSRLLREELRGELGERITRNVRKLVRREIMRVLETRTLD